MLVGLDHQLITIGTSCQPVQTTALMQVLRFCAGSALWHRCKPNLPEFPIIRAAAITTASRAAAAAADPAAKQPYLRTQCTHLNTAFTNSSANTLQLVARGLSGILAIGVVNGFASSHYHTTCSHQQEVHNPQSQTRTRIDAADGAGSNIYQPGLQTKPTDAGSTRQRTGRFYDTVTVVPCTAAVGNGHSTLGGHDCSLSRGYQLFLHKYPIRTPAKNVLVLPTYSLALAVAAEWEWLPKGKPAAHLMPLMSLAATAVDQPRERSKVVQHLLKYTHTDGACIRYEPGPLQRRQAELFDPLLSWAQQELGWHLHTTDSIAGTTQPFTTIAAAQQYLQGLDQWQLAAAEQLTTASKSLVIAAAVLHERLTVEQAIAAARVEEDFQLEDWGVVEAGHDLDIADANVRMGAPALFHKLLSQP